MKIIIEVPHQEQELSAEQKAALREIVSHPFAIHYQLEQQDFCPEIEKSDLELPILMEEQA